jgi:hypothetical protein
MDSLEKFKETHLPTIEKFYSDQKSIGMRKKSGTSLKLKT